MGKENILSTGAEFGKGLRNTSRYVESQKILRESSGLNKLKDVTPPVGVNLRILVESMPVAMDALSKSLPNRPNCTFLGLAIVDGIEDMAKVMEKVGRFPWSNLNVVDIDGEIISQVKQAEFDNVTARLSDARQTGIETGSQHLIVRDHLGNCCPPAMYAEIEPEAARILSLGGLSLVNITTNENLKNSRGRKTIPFNEAKSLLGSEVISALRERIFNLSQLSREFPEIEVETLRGALLEIAPEVFVVFGEDEVGHGEWFSTLDHQIKLWASNGLVAIDHNVREGNDSHDPPLSCVRHIVLLQKQKR